MAISRWESSYVVALAAAITCAITAERALGNVRRSSSGTAVGLGSAQSQRAMPHSSAGSCSGSSWAVRSANDSSVTSASANGTPARWSGG